MTLFSAIRKGCGLLQREAAQFLGASIESVKSWETGRRRVPAVVLRELRHLAHQQQRAAEEAFAVWDESGRPDVIELGLASDDYEAQSLGWPCVGAQLAAFRRLWELLPEGVQVRIVPRGSTIATAAAIEARTDNAC